MDTQGALNASATCSDGLSEPTLFPLLLRLWGCASLYLPHILMTFSKGKHSLKEYMAKMALRKTQKEGKKKSQTHIQWPV